MCCCPIRCIQCIVVTVAFIMLVVGSITIGSSVYAKNNQFLIYAGDSTTISIIALIFGIMTTLISLFGIYGGFKRNRLCLLIFAINLICIFAVELALTIAIFKTRTEYESRYGRIQCPNQNQILKTSENQLSSNPSKIKKLIELYRVAGQNLCTKQCPCNYQYPAPLSMKTTQELYIVAFQQCSNYDKKTYQVQANLMAAVEATYQCSGICLHQKPVDFPVLFYFSDVNNHKGAAKGLCDDEIWSFIKYSSNWGGGMTAGMAALSLLSFIVLMFLCFHPNKAQYWEVPRDEDQI